MYPNVRRTVSFLLSRIYMDTNTVLFILLVFIVSTVFGLGWFCLGWYTRDYREVQKSKLYVNKVDLPIKNERKL